MDNIALRGITGAGGITAGSGDTGQVSPKQKQSAVVAWRGKQLIEQLTFERG